MKLKQYWGDSDIMITVEYVKDIPILASGKRKSVIYEWRHD